MPSRAEMRVRLEHVLRAIVIAALAVMLWQSLREQTDSNGQSVRARRVGGGVLARWSSASRAPAAIHLQLDSVPAPVERAWLGALSGAGSTVTWSGDLPPVMIDAQPVASPIGGSKVSIAAPDGSPVVIGDDIGVIDTIRTQNRGASLALNSVTGNLTARVKGSVASTAQGDSVVLHKILVIGNAGWESKFVIAAFEEEGWKVDAFTRVAPGVDVAQGSAAVIDTSRYSAVVALDGAASAYANQIIEFAQTGGGVLLAPPAASLNAMSLLRAGSVGRRGSEAHAIQAGGSVSIATLALAPITLLTSDALPLEKRAGAVAIAARRIGAGRAIQVGYEDTWRWRMGGGDEAVRDHRIWWTGLVSNVAYAPRVQLASAASSTDEAPMIGLVAAIGPSAPRGAGSNLSATGSDWIVWLSVLLALGLTGELASRRLRGAA